jgi:NADPH-dependent 2,4-dienoyl-CoA reductase/sulfur reductase-like enzyme
MAPYRYLILGGGVVAGYAAQAFVEAGIEPGELAIVSADNTLPYERPPLSKAYLAGEKEEKDILINEPGFYKKHGIDTYLNTPIEHVDLDAKKLTSGSHGQFTFDKLLIARQQRRNALSSSVAALLAWRRRLCWPAMTSM